MDIRFALVLSGALLTACANRPTDAVNAALEPLEHAKLDQVHRLPGVDFSQWNTLYVEAPEMIYDRSRRFDRRPRTEDDFQLNARELERLRDELVKALEFEWSETPGWTVVQEPGPDTLVLQPVLSNFYLYTPIRGDYPRFDRNYTRESSRFLLQVRLVAPDGELLLETRDRRVTGDRGAWSLTRFSAVVYWKDVYIDFQRWARQLRPALVAS